MQLFHSRSCETSWIGDAACRLAWVVEVMASDRGLQAQIPADVAELCQQHLGPNCLEGIPLVRLVLWQEDDAPAVICPACCVWTESGLNTLPVKPGSLSAILRRIAGTRSSSAVAARPGCQCLFCASCSP